MLQRQMIRTRKSMALAGLILGVAASASWGQCEPGWSEVFTPQFMSGGYQANATLFDDGSGMKLIVSDLQRFGDEIGGLQVWDGSAWSILALPVEATGGTQLVRAVNDHVPPRLLLADINASDLQDVYIYEEGAWQAMGFPDGGFGAWWANDMTTGLDPAGDDIFVSGLFYQRGGKFSLVYRFDGESWAPIDTDSGGASATTLVWFDDGSGRKLYAGVRNKIDGMAVAGVARWDGTAWEEVGGGCPANWPSITVHDDGSGPALWALDNEGLILARWDGAVWTEYPLDPAAEGIAWRPISLSIGGAQEMYWIEWLSSDTRLWRWDGVDGELVTEVAAGHVWDVATDPTGTLGEGLFAVGNFLQAGETDVAGAARWDGSSWHALANTEVGNGAPYARAIFSVGETWGEALGWRVYVATSLAGGEPTGGVATWSGTQWELIGPEGMQSVSVNAFETGDLGAGSRVFAAGYIKPDDTSGTAVIAWDGQTWSVVGDQMGTGTTNALTFGSLSGGEPGLFVGGRFDVINGESFYGIAGLNADGWVHLGGGLPSSVGTTSVQALALHNDGSGTALYAGGEFQYLDPELANGVVRWDGNTWTRVGSTLGPIAAVYALCSADLGDGRKLYTGGEFDGNDGNLHNVAVWDGSLWQPLGEGLPFVVDSLHQIETGQGRRLAATPYPYTSDQPDDMVYLWDGVAWTPFGSESDGRPRGLAQAHHEYEAIYVVGTFTEVAGVPSEGIARFGCETCLPDFNGDGTLDTRDFVAFLSAWAAGDGSADWDGDGDIDTIDFLAFLGAWSAGC